MTDCDFVAEILKDHAWHSTAEVLRYSLEERGCGLTVHSRVAQLRKERNLNIETRCVKGRRGERWQYRLLGESATSSPGPADSPSRAVRETLVLGSELRQPVSLGLSDDPLIVTPEAAPGISSLVEGAVDPSPDPQTPPRQLSVFEVAA